MLNENYNILLIDDDPDILASYQDLLNTEGYHVLALPDPQNIEQQIPNNWIGLILCDVLLPNISGLDVLKKIMEKDAQIPVIMISGHGDVPMAVEAVQKGAINFLEKPLSPEKLLQQVEKSLQKRTALIQHRQWQTQKLQETFIGQSEWMNHHREQLQKLANTDLPVFLHGQVGTGRFLSATHLHQLSQRHDAAFVHYNSHSQTCSLIQACQQAKHGTLVITNLQDLTLENQQLLAQTWHEMHFRLIVISDLDLMSLIQQQRLISELSYLFLHTQLELLPLHQHISDIPAIFIHYAKQHCQRLNQEWLNPNKKLLQHLMQQPWLGNIRELIQVAELYALGLYSEEATNPTIPRVNADISPLAQQLETYEKQLIEDALIFYQGKINDVAHHLSIPRKKLYLRMRKYGLEKSHYKY